MKSTSSLKAILPILALLAIPVCYAGPQESDGPFHKGTVISDFGDVADVESDVAIPEGTKFKVRFDIGRKARAGAINSTFDSAARFINVNVAAGMPKEDIEIAIVVHGSAAQDVTTKDFYASKNEGRKNGSEKALATLRKHNVQFYLCGQSAAYQGIAKGDLLEGVKVAPSAMTIHALLDLKGFSLNPF